MTIRSQRRGFALRLEVGFLCRDSENPNGFSCSPRCSIAIFKSPLKRLCNFFQCPFSNDFQFPDPVVNGPRRASEATTAYPASKYRKIGEWGILATFPAGKHETSDFFATNYGCLPWKVRKFVPKKPDVFALKHGIFRRFLRCL